MASTKLRRVVVEFSKACLFSSLLFSIFFFLSFPLREETKLDATFTPAIIPETLVRAPVIDSRPFTEPAIPPLNIPVIESSPPFPLKRLNPSVIDEKAFTVYPLFLRKELFNPSPTAIRLLPK